MVFSLRDTDAIGSAQENLGVMDPWAKASLGALSQTWELELMPDT